MPGADDREGRRSGGQIRAGDNERRLFTDLSAQKQGDVFEAAPHRAKEP